jgi:hypothetical protein
VVLGGIFVSLDLKNAWRSEFAEIAGAAAFALMTGALAAAADCPALVAGALAFAMLARAVPTVIFVRAGVRGAKTGAFHAAPAVIAAALAVAGALALAWYGLAPFVLAVALTLLWARSAILLLVPPPHLRPRTLGFVELAVGAAYVASLSWAWRSTIP